MTISITITIDWPAIHAACASLDQARKGPVHVLGHGLYDAFGGTYFGHHYERLGIAGLVKISNALTMITEDAWRCIHRAKVNVDGAGRERIEDGRYTEQVLDDDGDVLRDPDGEPVIRHRYSFRRRRAKAAERRKIALKQVQTAVATMLAARPLYDLLQDAGVMTGSPDESITAAYGDNGLLNITGLRWLAGDAAERSPISITVARAFVERGIEALR